MAFQRKNFKNKPSITNVAANATAQPNIFRPKVEDCKTIYDAVNDKEFYVVNVNFIHPEDISEIINQWKSQLGNESSIIKILPNQKNSCAIVVKFPIELKTTFVEKYSPILTNILLSFQGKYDPERIRKIGEYINTKLELVVTKEDENNMNDKIGTNWKDMLFKLNDPELRKKILTYSLSSDYDRQYGRTISARNVSRVLAQKPNATFVTNAETWNRYNRIVNPNAQRILIIRRFSPAISKAELDKAAVLCGFSSYKDAEKQAEISKFSSQARSVNQVLNNIKRKAADISGKIPHYEQSVVYDVSDTTVMPKKEDEWAKMMGLSDNIRGILNSAASIDAMNKNGNKAQANTSPNNVEKEKELQTYANKLAKKIPNFNPSNYSDLGAAIVHGAQDYAFSQCPRFNVLEDKNKKRICGAVSLAVAATLEIRINVMNTWFKQNYSDITKKDAIIAFNIYTELLDCITTRGVNENKNMISENNILSKEGFFNMLQDMGINIVKDEPQESENNMTVETKLQNQKKSIKESFDDMLRRMDKVIIW